MTPVRFSDRETQVLDLLLQDRRVVRTIAEEDEMYQSALDLRGDAARAASDYFTIGMTAASVISSIIRTTVPAGHASFRILDLGAGYGRVTRFLAEEFGAAAIDVADVQRAALRFQQEQLGVRAFESTPDARRFTAAPPYSAVVAVSLFTHLPRRRFHAWLERVASLLQPQALFLFSVHDQTLTTFRSDEAGDEIVFLRDSESSRLPLEEYGATWVSDRFVRSAIRSAFGEKVLVQRIPSAFSQDLYVVIKNGPSADLDAELPLLGEVDRCSFSSGEVELHGWAAARSASSPVTEIVVRTPGTTARTSDFSPRPDVAKVHGESALGSGWTCRVAGVLPETPTVVSAISASGRETPIFAGLAGDAGYDPERTAKDLAHRLAAAEKRIWNLRTELAAIQSSRLWRVREVWLRLKTQWMS